MAAAKSLVSFPELQRNNFVEGNTGTEHFVWNADLRAPVKIDNVETDSKNDMETESKDDNDESSSCFELKRYNVIEIEVIYASNNEGHATLL